MQPNSELKLWQNSKTQLLTTQYLIFFFFFFNFWQHFAILQCFVCVCIIWIKKGTTWLLKLFLLLKKVLCTNNLPLSYEILNNIDIFIVKIVLCTNNLTLSYEILNNNKDIFIVQIVICTNNLTLYYEICYMIKEKCKPPNFIKHICFESSLGPTTVIYTLENVFLPLNNCLFQNKSKLFMRTLLLSSANILGQGAFFSLYFH